MKIPLISSLIHYFKVVYRYGGRKIYILLLLFLFGGISESIGISMLLPVLNIDKAETAQDQYTKTIYNILEFVGIGVSLFSLMALLLAAFLLKGVFLFLQKSIAVYIRVNLVKSIRFGFCQKYKDMKYSYFTGTNIGYLNNVITTETDRAVAVLNRYSGLIGSLIFISIYISFAFAINHKITILVFVLSFIMFALLRGLARMSRRLSILVSKTNAQIQSLLIQSLYNFKYLKATDSFRYIYKQLFPKIDKNYIYQFQSGILTAIPSSIVEPLSVLFLSGLVFYYVGYEGRSIAEIFVLLVFFYKTFSYIFRFQADWQKFNASLGGLEIINEASKILDKNIERTGTRKIEKPNKAIELKNVDFSYGSKQVLFNINLTIPKNRTVGIVGESGAGKTTLFDVLTGLLMPQAGSVCIDGIDYRELDISSLRGMIGYVTQEPVIFNDTIANNISFWECDSQEDVCKRRIKDAVDLSSCERFINETEKGNDTIIGEKGVKLSGGQRQRIAIARELFKEPEIMIFDEATSALDTESEQLIQQSINSLKGERTVVIIAHRLSTVRNCDFIYVFKEGRIVDYGSFDELYNDKDSIFSKMCQAQNL
jgi:subfamily B ATP-binding cassette protein MsbA